MLSNIKVKYMPAQLEAQLGMTLIELSMVMTVFALLSIMIAPIFSQGISVNHYVASDLQMMEQLRYASERMVREIRATNYTGTQYDISSMTTNTYKFVKVDDSANEVTLTIGLGGNLLIGYSSASLSATLLENILSFSFNYYDLAGAVTSSTTNVRFVEFNISMQNPETNRIFSQRGRVALRDKD